MKSSPALALIGAMAAVGAGWPGAAPSQDRLVLKSGEVLAGRLEALTDTIATVALSGPGGGSARRTLAAETIDWIEFGYGEGEEAVFVRRAEASSSELKPWWDHHFPHLHRPRSRCAAFGLAYAAALMREDPVRGAAAALPLLDRMIERAWSPGEVAAARRGRIRALLAAGELNRARAESAGLAAETGDPTLLLEAEHLLALADFDELRRLVRDNPRWEEDEEVRPRREELFHRALDAFLKPHLFHATREELAARGLHQAAELFLFAGETAEARARWGDLLALYPTTSPARSAAARLSDLGAEAPVAPSSTPNPP